MRPAKEDGFADELRQIVDDGPMRRYRGMVPESDTNGDRADDWDTLVRRVSLRCGTGVGSPGVGTNFKRPSLRRRDRPTGENTGTRGW
jgi:hypothetical protein